VRVLIVALKLIEYRWLVVEHLARDLWRTGGCRSLPGLGIWLGLKLTRHKETGAGQGGAGTGSRQLRAEEQKLEALGITPRELEILELIRPGAE
jgi:hypothetical protein